jgi:hypothetical protein
MFSRVIQVGYPKTAIAMITYKNKKGFPIIRTCANCIHFNKIESDGKLGYCGKQPVLFAFTMEQTVFLLTKPYYLCQQHELKNEAHLAANSEPVDLKAALKKKEHIT